MKNTAILFIFLVMAVAGLSAAQTSVWADEPPQCANSLMDNGEQGVDCGGPCSAQCPFIVRPDHPRLFITRDRIPMVRCHLGMAGYEGACSDFGALHDLYYETYRPVAIRHLNDESPSLSYLAPISFSCLIEEGPDRQQFCNAAKRFADTYVNNEPQWEGDFLGRTPAMALFFDWAYDTLTAGDRERYGAYLENGTRQYIHDTKDRATYLPWAPVISHYLGYPISIYGEGINDTLAFEGLNEAYYYYKEAYIPVFEEIMNEGCVKGYAGPRLDFMLHAAAAFKSAMNKDFFAQTQVLKNMGTALYHRMRSDRVVADGPGKYNVDTLRDYAALIAGEYNDSLMQSVARYSIDHREQEYDSIAFNPLYMFLFYDSTVNENFDYGTLEKTYTCPEVGVSYMRDANRSYAQSSPDAIHAGFFNGPNLVSGEIGAQNHFIIARGSDPLIIHGANYQESDAYFWFGDWFSKTISHNGLLIERPGDNYGTFRGIPLDNDGGAYTSGDRALGDEHYPVANYWSGVGLPYRGKISRSESNDIFTYVRGSDAQMAYHAGKISEWTRDFVYLRPGLFLVFDRVDSPDGSLPKKIVLHTVNKPQLNGNTQQIEGSPYGGIYRSTNSSEFFADKGLSRIFVRSLIPENKVMHLIGGANSDGLEMRQDRKPEYSVTYAFPQSYEWYYQGVNHVPMPDLEGDVSEYSVEDRDNRNNHPANPSGDWRVEIESLDHVNRDYFLYALSPASNETLAMVPTDTIDSENAAGALVDSHTAVLFAKRDNIPSATFDVKTQGMVNMYFFGLTPLAGYDVGVDYQTVTLSSGGNQYRASKQGVLSFSFLIDGEGGSQAPYFYDTPTFYEMDEGTSLQIPAYASDYDAQDTVAVTVVSKPFWVSETNNQPGNPAAILLEAVPGDIGPAQGEIVLRAADNHGALSDIAVTVTVDPVNHTPYFFNTQMSYNMDEGSLINVTSSARDDDSADTINVSVVAKPAWVSVVSNNSPANPAAVNLRAAPGYQDSGMATVTLRATDNQGAAADISITITVNDVDRTPPAVSNVRSKSKSTSVTITWNTDELSTSQVEYGTTVNYGRFTGVDTRMVKKHTVLITGLSLGAQYHFRVRSKDAAQNEGVSLDYVFRTTGPGRAP